MPAPDGGIDDGVPGVAGDAPASPDDGERSAPNGTPPDLEPPPPEAGDAAAAARPSDPPLVDLPHIEPLEPWPDPLEMTQPMARRMGHTAASAPASDPPIGHGAAPGALPRYRDARREPLPELAATYVDVETPAPEDAGVAEASLEASPGHPFEPAPFAVLPPGEAPSPSLPSAPQLPALGPVKARLVAAADRRTLEAPLEAPRAPSETPPPPAQETPAVAPPEAETPISLQGPPAPAHAAAPAAGLQIPHAPAADLHARVEPSFGKPRPQDGFLDYRPRPEPSWPGPAAPEAARAAPDIAPNPSVADPWASFGAATPEASESRRAPPVFATRSDRQLFPGPASDMAAAMGAASAFTPTAAVAPDAAAVRTPAGRDWRDLIRRIAHGAFLLFAGWFIAVLVLIVAYRFVNPPFSMLMAQQFLTGTRIQKQWVPLEQISPNLRRAVIVSEDGRFCRHWGVDLIEAANALKRASDGYPRGASTITMQVAKNLFLLPAKSYVRKLIELPLTFAIELAWPKARILEIYLNIVEWGPGIFGAEAASKAHFGRSAASLSPRQAAQLAVALPNPIVRNAGRPGPRTARRASVIQKRAAGARGASSCADTVR